MNRCASRILITLAILIGPGIVQAAINVSTIDRGHYRTLGAHDPSNEVYIAGWGTATFGELRNFLLFDLNGISQPIQSATLSIFNLNGGFTSPDSSETYEIYDVSTSAADLVNGTNGASTFIDLGTGQLYGSVTISDADQGQQVIINLNNAAITDINQSIGGTFAIGGRVSSLTAAASEVEYVFASSGYLPEHIVELSLVPIPEHSMTTVLISLAALLTFLPRRFHDRR